MNSEYQISETPVHELFILSSAKLIYITIRENVEYIIFHQIYLVVSIWKSIRIHSYNNLISEYFNQTSIADKIKREKSTGVLYSFSDSIYYTKPDIHSISDYRSNILFPAE